MTTEWPGTGHFSSDLSTIHGSSLSIPTVRKNFQYGSMSGGIRMDPQLTYYHQQYSKALIATSFKPRDYTTSRQFNSSKSSRCHGFSVGVIKSPNTTIL